VSALRTAVVVLFVALLVTSCGGGNKNARLTHAEFVSRVDKLCQQATSQVKQIPTASGTSLHQIERFVYHLRTIQMQFLSQAAKLHPPVKDEALWSKALEYDNKLLSTWTQIHEAAVRGDAKAARRLYQHLQTIALNPYFKQLGMTGC